MTKLLPGDKVNLTGTVTRVGDDHDPPMITVEIEGYWAKATVTLSVSQLDRACTTVGSHEPVQSESS